MHQDKNIDYMSLADAAKTAPGRPSANALWRWCRRGVLSRGGQRVRLQHVRIGGKIYTRREWVEDFGQRLAAADAEYFDLATGSSPAPSVRSRTSADRRRDAEIARADRRVEHAGG